MNADQLIDRYWRAIVATTHKTQDMINDDAILLALNLAVTEAYDAGAALCNDMAAIIAAQKTIGPELRQAEADRAQMALIAEWLAEHEPALYYGEHGGYGDAILDAVRKRDAQIDGLQQEIARMDADNADLAAKLQNATLAWKSAQSDADRLALRIAQQPAGIHVNGNGNGAAQTEVDDWRFYLTDAEQEFLESVETGRRRFGSLERSTRLAIAQAFTRHVGNGLPPTQAVFDAAKPAWMPGAGGIAAGFGVPWSQILDLDPMTVQR